MISLRPPFVRNPSGAWLISPTHVAGFVELCGLLPLAFLGGNQIWIFLVGMLASAIGYGVAILRLERDMPSMRLIWGFALAFRLVLIFNPPSLSDDVYRYLWDGHLMVQGQNPYAQTVNSSVLDALSTPLRERVNHAWMASPYLPAAQTYFAALEWIDPQNPRAHQVASAALDLVVGGLVLLLLRRSKMNERAVLIYLWNPLVVVEFAHGAHVDAWMLVLLMLALILALNRRPLAAGLALAAAVLTKGLALLLLPLLGWRLGWKGLLVCAFTLIAALAVFLPGASLGLGDSIDGRGVFGASRIFLSYWRFNGGLYDLLEAGLHAWLPDQGVAAARLFSAGAVLAALVWTTQRAMRLERTTEAEAGARLLRLVLVPWGVYLLFSAALHPWYAAILIPFLPFLWGTRWQDFLWPWLYFSLALPLSYLAYHRGGPVEVPLFVGAVEYIPLYAGLSWALARTVRQRIRV